MLFSACVSLFFILKEYLYIHSLNFVMMLVLKDINKSFGTPGEANSRKVLSGLSFQMEKGESVAILGPSGSGKTTLLNIIGTLDHPDSGEVFFKDRNISNFSGKALDQFRNLEIGFVFQFHHLLPQCTLLENILIPTMTLREKQDKTDKMEYALELLQRLGIHEHRNKLPGKMSGGECQRAAVVRAMINRPSLLLADEPTGALDSQNAEIIAELLTGLNKTDGLGLMVVTHSMGTGRENGSYLPS